VLSQWFSEITFLLEYGSRDDVKLVVAEGRFVGLLCIPLFPVLFTHVLPGLLVFCWTILMSIPVCGAIIAAAISVANPDQMSEARGKGKKRKGGRGGIKQNAQLLRFVWRLVNVLLCQVAIQSTGIWMVRLYSGIGYLDAIISDFESRSVVDIFSCTTQSTKDTGAFVLDTLNFWV